MEYRIVIAVIIGYLLGSIPFAYIITRLKKGVDIRRLGGGNVGALNTYREVGPAYGIGVLVADIAKGAVAVLVARWLDLSPIWICVAGFAAITGHNWPVWLGFRGGKGAATVIGVMLALTPIETLIGGITVLVLIAIIRNVRLSLVALVLTPLLAWVFDRDIVYVWAGLGLLLFIGILTGISLLTEISRSEVRKNLIVDKDHTAWQTKKKN